MKKLSFLLAAIILMVANSCKKETVDVTDLLTTVPSSAAGVMVINIEGLAEDAGCKIKDHAIVAGEDVENLIKNASVGSQEDLKWLFNGDSGIEPKGAVVFYDANRTYLTCALYNVEKFMNFVEEKAGGSFSSHGSGVKVCGAVAVKGAQAWINLTPYKPLDADGIAAYASLSPSQSFLVTPMGEKLLDEEDDLRGWARLDTFIRDIMGSKDKTFTSIGIGLLFDKAESVKFKLDFKKGEAEAELVVLNKDFKPAKFQLPMEKVDVNVLKSLGQTCNGMMAFTLTPKLVKKLDDINDTFGGILFADLGSKLKNVDGTVGIIGSASDMNNISTQGVITLSKGDLSQDIRDFISEYLGNLTQDGKYVRFSKGDVSGNLSVEECAEELKGCYYGLIMNPAELMAMGYEQIPSTGIKNVVFKLDPDSGGIEVKLEINTVAENENALLTLLKVNK